MSSKVTDLPAGVAAGGIFYAVNGSTDNQVTGGAANGLATLDAGGKLPVSQSQTGAMSFGGDWNASTNTPTLANGVGTAGVTHIVSVAGSQNLGAGVVNYAVGDMVVYDGALWDHYPGSSIAVPTGANPTALAGLAAVNGAATTFMRSDAAPALNQAITPTWTGVHKWTQGIDVQGGVSVAVTTDVASATNSGILLSPAPNIADILFFDSGLAANNRTAEWIFFQGKLQARFKNDAGNAAVTPLAFAGGQAAGITGIESNSGSGAWAHTGNMNVNGGAFGVAGVVNFTPSGIGWLGNNVPWEQFGGGTGLPGDVWTSTGNATSPGWSTHLPQKVGGSSATAQSANVNTPNFYAVAVGGMYRVSTFIVITRAATTSATMPGVSVGYTEAASGANVQDIVSLSSVANTVGSHSGGTAVIQCQQGSNISYSTSNYASSGATSMQYRVDVVVERLT